MSRNTYIFVDFFFSARIGIRRHVVSADAATGKHSVSIHVRCTDYLELGCPRDSVLYPVDMISSAAILAVTFRFQIVAFTLDLLFVGLISYQYLRSLCPVSCLQLRNIRS